jgi:hypothetical protein
MTANAAENAASQRTLREAAGLIREAGNLLWTSFNEGLGKPADDTAEGEAVYRLVADYVSEQLGIPFDRVLPTIISLCEGISPADYEQPLEAVQKWLLRLRITYACPRSGPVTRTVEMIVDPGPTGARIRTVEQRLSRDDLPADVRQHMLRAGSHEVTFQPYPRSN